MLLAFVPELESDARCVAVQRRGVGGLVVVAVDALGDQQRGGLREVAVEQFVELVAGVDVGPGGRTDPDRADDAQHRQQQAPQQRRRAHVSPSSDG